MLLELVAAAASASAAARCRGRCDARRGRAPARPRTGGNLGACAAVPDVIDNPALDVT
jgi:hypothetical protein